MRQDVAETFRFSRNVKSKLEPVGEDVWAVRNSKDGFEADALLPDVTVVPVLFGALPNRAKAADVLRLKSNFIVEHNEATAT